MESLHIISIIDFSFQLLLVVVFLNGSKEELLNFTHREKMTFTYFNRKLDDLI